MLGCAGFSQEPRRLFEQAREELELRHFALAYEHLATIRTRYPRSAESQEAFDLAALAFQALYFRNRSIPDTPWMKTEPLFVLDWLATFFQGDAFPQARVEALVRGMPRAFLAEYQSYAASHLRMARWNVTVTDDNGLIDSITAEPADARLDSAI